MLEYSNFVIDIAPILHGRLTKPALLRSDSMIVFVLGYEMGIKSGQLFSVSAPAFTQTATITTDTIELSRNMFSVVLPLAATENQHGYAMITVMWSPTELTISIQDDEGQREKSISTPPTFPPHALIEWARREALLPVVSYKNPTLMFQSVLEQLQLLVGKIIDTNAINGFWDVTYNGKKIVSRSPKRETDIHPQIRFLLYDLELQRGLQIVPECLTGSGRLDFLISGRTDDGVIVNVCVEFKLAHSNDIAHGIEIQLPEYMSSRKTDYGIYAVLFFGDEYPADISKFTIPAVDTSMCSLDFVLPLAASNTGRPYLKTVLFDMSKKKPPSKV